MKEWHRKEKPIQGMIGAGGGATGYLTGGVAGGSEELIATGGSTYDYTWNGNPYRSHTFENPGTFQVTATGATDPTFQTVDLFMIGGGGGGGSDYRGGAHYQGGGGGGGGFVQQTSVPVGVQSYSVSRGGPGSPSSSGPGGSGGNSTCMGYTANGGG